MFNTVQRAEHEAEATRTASSARARAKPAGHEPEGQPLQLPRETLNKEPVAVDQLFLDERLAPRDDDEAADAQRGMLEFDYVSTTRPPRGCEVVQKEPFAALLEKVGISLRRKQSSSRATCS